MGRGDGLGDLAALAGVRDDSGRVECATLPGMRCGRASRGDEKEC